MLRGLRRRLGRPRGGGELVDIKRDKDLITVPVRGHRSNISRVKIPRFLLEADHIINLPILKAHASMVFSCALKNIKGTVQGRVHMDMHRETLTISMMDVWYAVRPDINIVDAMYAAGGFSPHTPVPKYVGCVLGSPTIPWQICSGERLNGIQEVRRGGRVQKRKVPVLDKKAKTGTFWIFF